MTFNFKERERSNSALVVNRQTNTQVIIKEFLKEIYKGIYKRSGRLIDKYTFHELTQFPLIISEKIFFYLNNSNSNKLSIYEFVNGIYDLYWGSPDVKINMLFHILDFTHDNIIHIEHVKLFYSYFHMINLTIENEYFVMDIIDHFFNGVKVLSHKDYKNRIYVEKNWDLIYIFEIYIHKYAFFNSKQISFFSKEYDNPLFTAQSNSNNKIPLREKSLSSNKNNQVVSSISYEPSDDCLDYADIVMDSKPIEPLITNCDDLDELDKLNNFECDLSNTMQCIIDKERNDVIYGNYSNNESVLNEEDIKSVYNKKLSKFTKQMTNNKFLNFLINRTLSMTFMNEQLEQNNIFRKLTASTNRFLLNNNTNIMNTSTFKTKSLKQHSTYHHSNSNLFTFPFYNNYLFLNNNTSNINHKAEEYFMFKLKKGSKISKCKLTIINNIIFYFKYSIPYKSYIFKKIIFLSQIFPKIEENIQINNNTYNAILLVSTLHNFKLTKTFISKQEKDIHSFYNRILSITNNKFIDDYYQFGPEIGKGRFGKVNFGITIGTNEKVAIKIISKFPNDNNYTEKSLVDYSIIKWEQDIFKYLQHAKHPNIISCNYLFETSSYIYYVYELMNYGNLKSYLKTKGTHGLTYREITEIAIQLLKGVSFLHLRGIIHRDIKYTNIMLNVNDDNESSITVKFIDFGLSRVIGRYETCNDPYGSLLFQAPEMLLGYEYDFKVDIWSLGVTIYFMLFKELPFEDKKMENIRDMILYKELEIPFIEHNNKDNCDQMYSFICALIFDCMKKNVNERLDIFGIVGKYFHTQEERVDKEKECCKECNNENGMMNRMQWKY